MKSGIIGKTNTRSINMSCKYLLEGIRRTAMRETQSTDSIKYCGVCNKFKDIDNYLEDEDINTYCKTENYIHCSIFNYLNDKCDKLLLKGKRGIEYKIPIINLDTTKFIHICNKAENVDNKYCFPYCDNVNYLDCPIWNI